MLVAEMSLECFESGEGARSQRTVSRELFS